MRPGKMLERMAPLRSGRDTEIDMIEREMEGGVVIIQPLDLHEDSADERLGGLVSVEKHVDVREFPARPPEAAKG